METIVATAILLASTLVLVQLISVGREHAWKADEVTKAQLLCQTKLNELLAGIAPLQRADEEVFDDDPDWAYSIEVQPLDVAGLVSVRVTVSELASDAELAQRTDQSPRGFHLVRWMRQAPVAVGDDASDEPRGDLGEEFGEE